MSRSTNPRHLRPQLAAIDKILNYFATKFSNVNFIQVGANDGKSDDPIHEYIIKNNWTGALIEPQAYVFENLLKETYKNHTNLKLINAAVGPIEGELPFYQISFSEESWATGLASFNKDNLTKHINQGYVDRKAAKANVKTPDNKSDYIKEVLVPVLTFDTIINQLKNKEVDLLCIDVEGFDYNVLKLFDFSHYKPRIVLYESKHLSDEEFIKSKDLLESNGYKLYWEKGNTVAINFSLPFHLKSFYIMSAFFRKL